MRPLIVKELKENLKWAVLLMLGMGLGMMFALNAQGFMSAYQGNSSICSASFLMVTLIGSAVAGTVLGLLQVVLESHRDQWAFLIHRPAERTTIFWGKVVAGILLYLFATAVPFLAMTIWAATPGHIPAPFDWRMALPGIADILTGVVFYFGGMLTGLRQARWYASRGLGIAAAIVCVVMVLVVSEFWKALGCIVASGAILAVTALGSFVSGGNYEPQTRLAKTALGISLTAGVTLVACAVIYIPSMFLFTSFFGEWHQYVIDREGRILQIVSDGFTIKEMTDLSGKAVAKKSSDFTQLEQLAENPLLSSYRWSGNYRSSSRFYFPVSQGGDPTWYYVAKEDWLEGYAARDKRLVGYLAPAGFSTAPTKPSTRFQGPFLGQRQWFQSHVFAFPRAVYSIDPPGTQVSRIFAAPDGTLILGACEVHSDYREMRASGLVAVATSRQVHILSPEAQPLLVTTYHHAVAQYSEISVTMTANTNRFFIWYKPSYEIQTVPPTLPDYITELDTDGSVLKDHTLPPLPTPQNDSGMAYGCVMGVLTPHVITGCATWAAADAWLGDERTLRQFASMVKRKDQLLAMVAAMLCSGLLCAGITLYISRRYAFVRKAQVWWSICNFFFGVTGLLLFLCLRQWPALEVCSSCGRKRAVNRDHCEHCDAEFALPARDGTEILES